MLGNPEYILLWMVNKYTVTRHDVYGCIGQCYLTLDKQ